MRNRQKKDSVAFLIMIFIILFFVGAMLLKGRPKTTQPEVPQPIIEEDEQELTAIESEFYITECKLSKELQQAIYETCNGTGIPYNVALGLIEVESTFNENALNEKTGCYGLCQLNPKYFPSDLTPEENIKIGICWLARLYGNNGGDMEKALTIYNVGHDNGTRHYATKVLKAAEKWGVKNK